MAKLCPSRSRVGFVGKIFCLVTNVLLTQECVFVIYAVLQHTMRGQISPNLPHDMHSEEVTAMMST